MQDTLITALEKLFQRKNRETASNNNDNNVERVSKAYSYTRVLPN